MCNKKFDYKSRNMRKVKDYCYVTGKYRDGVCSICNFK